MKKTRITALLTAAAVLAGSTNIFAANFADINNVPWEGAKTYIQNVADIGLMVGESDGKHILMPLQTQGLWLATTTMPERKFSEPKTALHTVKQCSLRTLL